MIFILRLKSSSSVCGEEESVWLMSHWSGCTPLNRGGERVTDWTAISDRSELWKNGMCWSRYINIHLKILHALNTYILVPGCFLKCIRDFFFEILCYKISNIQLTYHEKYLFSLHQMSVFIIFSQKKFKNQAYNLFSLFIIFTQTEAWLQVTVRKTVYILSI